MVFSSLVFLFVFLPLVLLVYHALFLPSLRGGAGASRLRRGSNLALLLFSLLFYAWGEMELVGVMVLSTAIDYGCGRWMGAAGAGGRGRRAALLLSLLSGLLLLGWFKYFDFGVGNWNLLVQALGLEGLAWAEPMRVALPIGISFYKFQSLSYTIDVYRGRVAPCRSFLDFACYVTMFPQLVAGPIVRYLDIAGQLTRRTLDLAGFHAGVCRFTIGLAKKVLVANVVALPADRIFALPAAELTTGLAWLGVSCYTIQIYFDFSGYSDMAIGLGRMLGFRFPENFLHPYISRSLREFWRRWHISLSTWFRDYLYIPLGGNRRGTARTGANLLIVFFLCGLWHGAQWTFVAWGLWHGLFLALERLGGERLGGRAPAPLAHLYTLLVVMCGWVLFRAGDFGRALAFFRALAGWGAPGGRPLGVELLTPEVALALAAGALGSTPILPRLQERWRAFAGSREGPLRPALEALAGGAQAAALAGLLLLCAVSLSSGTYNPFIYFRF